jgi:hypothetical protein
MSQILCWGIDYKPVAKPWNTVRCNEKKKVMNYLQQDSIILVSSEIWSNEEYKQFLVLSKLHFPNIQIGIVVSRKRKANSLVTYLQSSEIEDFIKGCKRRHFTLIDHKKMVEEGNRELVTGNSKKKI